MNRIAAHSALVLVLVNLPAVGWGQGRSFTDRTVPGMQQADRHNPFSRNYTDMTPGGYARRQAQGYGGGRSYGGHAYSFSTPYLYDFYGAPGFYDYGYYDAPPLPPFDYGYAYPPPILYPSIIPSEPLFGPRALWNRHGVAPPAAAPGQNIVVLPPKNDANKAVVEPRPVNAETWARAGRLLNAGDEHFQAQRYRDANQRYRTATETASEMVEAHFRQGQALLALGQYDLASKAFQRGLKIGPQWTEAEFDLVNLYGENHLARSAHVEAVAAAASEEPHRGDLLLLVGLQLYFDGQQERAMPFLRKASALLADPSLNLSSALEVSEEKEEKQVRG